MVERKSTAKAQLKVRLREPLRAQLEVAARNAGWSLNTEIVRRLEASVRDDDLGAIIFGDAVMYAMMDCLARAIRGVEKYMGKTWTEDAETYQLAVELACAVLKSPQSLASGGWPHEIRSLADYGAFAIYANALKTDADRRLSDAIEGWFEGWWAKVKAVGIDKLLNVSPQPGETLDDARERTGRDIFEALRKVLPAPPSEARTTQSASAP